MNIIYIKNSKGQLIAYDITKYLEAKKTIENHFEQVGKLFNRK